MGPKPMEKKRRFYLVHPLEKKWSLLTPGIRVVAWVGILAIPLAIATFFIRPGLGFVIMGLAFVINYVTGVCVSDRCGKEEERQGKYL